MGAGKIAWLVKRSACKHGEWRLTPRTHAFKKLRVIPSSDPITGEVEEGGS